MSERYVLGIDVGTTGTKALLISQTGKIVDSAYESYLTHTPGIGKSEQNPLDWWAALVKVVRCLCAEKEISKNVSALCLSTQGGTILPANGKGEPLAPAIVWNDRRCAKDGFLFEQALGKDYFYKTCGWKLGKGLPAMQLRRMKEDRPEIFKKAKWFLSVADYLAFQLTGQAVVDISNVGINQLANIQAACYDSKILDFIGVNKAQLAKIVQSGEIIGNLTPAAAQELGLNQNTILVSGAHDQYAMLLGAGVCEAGEVVIGTGTAWVALMLNDEPDFIRGISQSVCETGGKWGSMASISTGGGCIDWLLNKIISSNELDYQKINEEVSKRPHQAENGLMFYPYFNGSSFPVTDEYSKGTFIGLDFSHDRIDMVKAVMEGVACQITWALEDLLQGQKMNLLKVTGGATNSPIWMQMLADLTQRPVSIYNTPYLGCIGAAVLAQLGAGFISDAKEGAGQLAKMKEVFIPTAEGMIHYGNVLKRYKKNASILRQMYKEMGEQQYDSF